MDYFLALGIEDIQFIPCLDSLEGEMWPMALSPEEFARFYDGVMTRWLRELRQGHWVHIQFIDAVVELLATGQELICGLKGSCRIQQVVEADGSAYPCDFYVLDEYRMGNLGDRTLSQLRASPAAIRFLNERPHHPALCEVCAYRSICRGGCRRMKNTMYLTRTGDACGYQTFLDHHYQTLRAIARQLGS